jgi:L-fuculose-phosphate aldolase
VVRTCHRLAAKGFVAAYDGNVSVRLSNANVLVTPTGCNKGDVSEEHLVEVTLRGELTKPNTRPSTELGMHLFIYRRRPDIHAIVHAHPPYATGFSAARVPLPSFLFPEVVVGLGSIPLAPYATPSTEEVADALEPLVMTSNAFLLSNHGVVTCGESLEEAYFRMEKVEQTAHSAFVAQALGGGQVLGEKDVAKLLQIGKQQ